MLLKTDLYAVYTDGTGTNVVPQVHKVLQHIKNFSDKVRSGAWKGASGQTLKSVVAIGIGGSYLGANYVYEALKSDGEGAAAAAGRELRFLANVDPVGVERALVGLNPATTLVIVISKTFTTRETMLNARTVRKWIVDKLGEAAVAKHVVAVSTNIKAVTEFGIDKDNVFEFWDWVGGRYSVCSAVGVLPLALQYSFPIIEKFLAGAHSIDKNFVSAASPRENLALLLGLIGVWNSSFLGYSCRALIPYSEAMNKLAAHIQQVDMESNGKRVTIDGRTILPAFPSSSSPSSSSASSAEETSFSTGEINFGEPGTNSQHSFFQLIHQGTNIVPVDFIGFLNSQFPIHLGAKEDVSNHDELMANYFAQPDALASGKTLEELRAEGVSEVLAPHRVMPGNRPSNLMLLPKLSAYEVGQILALYEHRAAVEGFIWNINSFDQFGVELGKKGADKVRAFLQKARAGEPIDPAQIFNPSTANLLHRYLSAKPLPTKL